MRRIDNPPNRFERLYREWDVEPPEARIEVFEDPTREILAENDSPDVGFRFSVNPYRGCTHACAYCYARPGHEYLGYGAGTDFDTRIVVKPRAAELLRAALARPSWQGDLIAFSGDTDCFQPLEAHYRLTRSCLEVCRDAGNPVQVITKSYLVTRDADVLAALAAEGLAAVAISIPFLDPEMARAIEPGAPRPAKRFEAMQLLARAGIPVAAMVAPLIPGLNDDQIPGLLEQASASGAREAGHILLRLPGAVQDVFLARLRERLPLRAERVIARIREARGGALNDPRFGHRMTGAGPYWQAVERSFELHCRRLGLGRRDRGVTTPHRRAPRLRRPGQLPLFG